MENVTVRVMRGDLEITDDVESFEINTYPVRNDDGTFRYETTIKFNPPQSHADPITVFASHEGVEYSIYEEKAAQ